MQLPVQQEDRKEREVWELQTRLDIEMENSRDWERRCREYEGVVA